jgi:hypothetical protein
MFRARWHGEGLLSQGLPVINNDSVPKVKDPRFQGAIQEQRGSVWGDCVTRVAFFDPATFAELEPLGVALVRNRWRREAHTRTTTVQLGHPRIQHGPMSGHTWRRTILEIRGSSEFPDVSFRSAHALWGRIAENLKECCTENHLAQQRHVKRVLFAFRHRLHRKLAGDSSSAATPEHNDS